MKNMYCLSCQTSYDSDTTFCPSCGLRLDEVSGDSVGKNTLLGKTIDNRYTIVKKIGVGGMGEVYRAVQKSVDRSVAVKLLRRELSFEPEVVSRFMHEAKVASKLCHPNTVSLFDFGKTEDGLLYIIMELLTGEPLSDKLRKRPLSVRETIQFGKQISSALREAHLHDIVHRDLKPDNIFITDVAGNQFVKVVDFGIAKVLNTHTNLTKTGQMFGTPAYMSPEQAQNEKIDTRSDTYSLGVILYEMLTGVPVFDSTTPIGLLLMHATEEPTHLEDFEPPVQAPTILSDLIMKMLSKKPDDRPQSVAEVEQVLEQLLLSGSFETAEFEVSSQPLKIIEIANNPAPDLSNQVTLGPDIVDSDEINKFEVKKEKKSWLVPGLIGAIAVIVLVIVALFSGMFDAPEAEDKKSKAVSSEQKQNKETQNNTSDFPTKRAQVKISALRILAVKQIWTSCCLRSMPECCEGSQLWFKGAEKSKLVVDDNPDESEKIEKNKNPRKTVTKKSSKRSGKTKKITKTKTSKSNESIKENKTDDNFSKWKW